jgi:DMSO/TMAO reductase YedYZ heme-binding membrane subunit
MEQATRQDTTTALDRAAMWLSGVCVVHCVATTVFVALMASAGGILFDEHIHEGGLAIAILLGATALGRGIWNHGYMMPSAVGALGLGVMAGALALPHNGAETLYTLLGVGLLALGHDLNRRAVV